MFAEEKGEGCCVEEKRMCIRFAMTRDGLCASTIRVAERELLAALIISQLNWSLTCLHLRRSLGIVPPGRRQRRPPW